MPIEATKHTAAGAEAFSRFFIQTIDWGYATTSGAYMKHYYASSCKQCPVLTAAFARAAENHEHYVGGRITVKSVRAISAVQHFGSKYTFGARIEVGSVYLVDSKRKISGLDTTYVTTLQTWVSWIRGEWMVVILNRLA